MYLIFGILAYIYIECRNGFCWILGGLIHALLEAQLLNRQLGDTYRVR